MLHYQAHILVLNRVHVHSKLLIKSDEEPPEIINESIFENFGIGHKEDILPLHEPHTRESYPTYSHSSLSQGTH